MEDTKGNHFKNHVAAVHNVWLFELGGVLDGAALCSLASHLLGRHQVRKE